MTQQHKEYKEYTKQRLLNAKDNGIQMLFISKASNININTLYTLTKTSDRSISIDKLISINNVIDKLDKILAERTIEE